MVPLSPSPFVQIIIVFCFYVPPLLLVFGYREGHGGEEDDEDPTTFSFQLSSMSFQCANLFYHLETHFGAPNALLFLFKVLFFFRVVESLFRRLF